MGSSPPSRAEPREDIIEHLGNTVAAITWASRHAPVFSWTFAKARRWQGNSCVWGLCLPSLMLERRLYSPKTADAVDAIGWNSPVYVTFKLFFWRDANFTAYSVWQEIIQMGAATRFMSHACVCKYSTYTYILIYSFIYTFCPPSFSFSNTGFLLNCRPHKVLNGKKCKND